jgi:Domain of unknown function (DUF4188)
LLLHENFIFSFFPMHAVMRQYWRDKESLLTWTRSDPHREWWQKFWHETYLRRGGMEAIYDDIVPQIGFMGFAPIVPARGPMFGAASRAGLRSAEDAVLSEKELYEKPARRQAN